MTAPASWPPPPKPPPASPPPRSTPSRSTSPPSPPPTKSTPPNSARYLKAATALFPALLALPTTAAEPEIIARAALAEVAVALPFLALEPTGLAPLTSWFTQYLTFLTEDRAALLVRDKNDYRGLTWLLQAAAFARLTAPESKSADTLLAELRHRFKTPTLRAHLDARGFFPHDLTTPNPFRNSLFSLDLLAGCSQLLSTRFESIWDFELPEGTGTRAAIARHAPYIATPATWPYPADLAFFHDLPSRRPALVFAARAYQQADYATLWQTLTPAQPTNPEILRTFPIRQPLLWLAQPRPTKYLIPTNREIPGNRSGSLARTSRTQSKDQDLRHIHFMRSNQPASPHHPQPFQPHRSNPCLHAASPTSSNPT